MSGSSVSNTIIILQAEGSNFLLAERFFKFPRCLAGSWKTK